MKNKIKIQILLASSAILIFNLAKPADDAWKAQKIASQPKKSLAEQLQEKRVEMGKSGQEGPILPPREKPAPAPTTVTTTPKPPALTPPPALQKPPALTPPPKLGLPPKLSLPSDDQLKASKAVDDSLKAAAEEKKKADEEAKVAEQKALLDEMKQKEIADIAQKEGVSMDKAAALHERRLELESGVQQFKGGKTATTTPKADFFGKARAQQIQKAAEDTPQSWKGELTKLSQKTGDRQDDINAQKVQKAMWDELGAKDTKYVHGVAEEFRTDHTKVKAEIAISKGVIKKLQNETTKLEKQLKSAKNDAERQKISDELAVRKESIEAMTAKNLEKGVTSTKNLLQSSKLAVAKMADDVKNTPKPTTPEAKKELAAKKAALRVAQSAYKTAQKEANAQAKELAKVVKDSEKTLAKISQDQQKIDARIKILEESKTKSHFNQPEYEKSTNAQIEKFQQQKEDLEPLKIKELGRGADLITTQRELAKVIEAK